MNDERYSDPAGSGEFGIGLGDSTDAAIRSGAEIALDAVMEDLRGQRNDVHKATLAIIDDCLLDCRATGEDCAVCLYGSIDRHIEYAETVRDELRQKVTIGLDRLVERSGVELYSLIRELIPDSNDTATADPPGPIGSNPHSGSPLGDPVDPNPTDPSTLPPCPTGFHRDPLTLVCVRDPADPPPDDPPPPPGGGTGMCKIYNGTTWLAGVIKTAPNGSKICCTPGIDIWGQKVNVNPFCCATFTEIQPADCLGVIIGPDGNLGPLEPTPPTDPQTGEPVVVDDLYCPRPAGLPSDSYLYIRDDGKSQWVDRDGKAYGELCESKDCPRPVGASAGSMVVTFSDGSKQWQTPDGSFVGPLCQAKCDTAECPPSEEPPAITLPAVEKVRGFCSPDNWKDYAEKPDDSGESACDIFGREYMEELHAAIDSQNEDGWFDWILDAPRKIFLTIFTSAIGVFFVLAVPVCKIVSNIVDLGITDAFKVLFNNGLIGWLGRLWPLPKSVVELVEQNQGLLVQTGIPSTADATAMRLVGVLDKDQWQFATRLNGDCVPWFEKVYDSGLAYPSIAQAYSLYRGGIIDRERWKTILERNRIPKDADTYEWTKLTEQLPGMADLVRMMVRDTADEQAVEQQQLDKDFTNKWSGSLKEWGDRQGISEDIAKNYWRAHWEFPSNVQLFNMLHRLRPGSANEWYNGVNVQTTAEDVRKVVELNDLAPPWVDAMMATSYLPPNMSLVRMGYVTSVFSREDLVERFQDLGYSLADSKVLSDAFAVNYASARAKFLGKYDADKAKNDYLNNGISEDEYRQALTDIGLTQDIVESSVNTAKIQKIAARRKDLMKNAKAAYFRGRISEDEYRQGLISQGFDPFTVDEIIRHDSAVREWKYKEISIAKMCKLVSQGYMTIETYLQRAKNLGYKESDAALMAQSCTADIMEKRQKQQEAQQRAAMQAAEKAERRAEQARKKEEKRLIALSPCRPRPKPVCNVGPSDNGDGG